VNGHRHEGPTKSGRTRYVPVPSSVWGELLAHVEKYGSTDPSAYIFTSPTGGPLRHRNFLRRVWDPAVGRAMLNPPPTPHDMRHTAASLMADAGYSLVEAQHVLGHSTQFMTSAYTHLFPDKLEALTGKLDRAIARARKSKGSGDVVRLRKG
jgi:integrase